jgi:hypothetical protein
LDKIDYPFPPCPFLPVRREAKTKEKAREKTAGKVMGLALAPQKERVLSFGKPEGNLRSWGEMLLNERYNRKQEP